MVTGDSYPSTGFIYRIIATCMNRWAI